MGQSADDRNWLAEKALAAFVEIAKRVSSGPYRRGAEAY